LEVDEVIAEPEDEGESDENVAPEPEPDGRSEKAAEEPFDADSAYSNGPITVKVGFKIVYVGAIDLSRGCFFVNFKTCATWKDPKIAWMQRWRPAEINQVETLISASNQHTPTVDSNPKADFRSLKLFDPDLHITNSLRMDLFVHEVRLSGPGIVEWQQHRSGELAMTHMTTLDRFPFDYHNLRICVRSTKLTMDECDLELWSGMHTMETEVSAHELEWDTCGHKVEVLETGAATSSTGKCYIELHICIMVSRRSTWYFYKLFLPMAVIVISALCSLANDTDAIEARLEALVSLLLAVVAIQFVFTDELPHVDRVSRLQAQQVSSVHNVLDPYSV
jgi:hypothetical protein